MANIGSYPAGTTVRNLIYSIMPKQQNILHLVKDGDDLPPWVLMLISRATSNIGMVEEFVKYYYTPQIAAMAGWQAELNSAPQILDQYQKMFHSGQMVRSLLYGVHFRETSILSMIKDNAQVPPWIIMKLSRATDDISTVNEYLTYEYAKLAGKV